MAVTDVEITISGARDVKNVNWKHGDLCAYAIAWVDIDGKPPAKVTTRVDASGDTNPSWEQTFTLSVSKEKVEDTNLTIEIYHDNAEIDSKKAIVGRASLALLDVMDAGGYNEALDYSLKLKRPSGRPHAPSSYGQSYYNDGGQGYSSAYPPQVYAQDYPYGGNPSYYGAPPPQPYGGTPSYGAVPSAGYSDHAAEKSSKFGGMGTGIAVGLVAGAVGGLALSEYIDHKEDEAAEEQAEEDAERYGYGGGDDDGYGDGGDDY